MLSSRPIFQKLSLPPQRDGDLWMRHGVKSGIHHRHAELEINLCVAGHAHYLVGERRFHLSRGHLLWLFPAQNHLLLDASPDFAMWIVVWKPHLIEATARGETSRELRQQAPAATWFSRLQNEDSHALEQFYQSLFAVSSDDHFNAGLSFALMETHAAHARAADAIAGRAVHPCVESAARLLRDEALDVPTLSRRVGLSANRLSRLFRAQIGVTVTEFRTRMALERFANLYDRRTLSLTQAAIEAGFGSYAQFHRAFSAHHGHAPARHRENLRAAEAAIEHHPR